MSGFANAIVGGMSKLVRKAIQSPDYAAGTEGWSINQDGSAEFNDIDVRGTINLGVGEIGIPSNSVNFPDAPAQIVAVVDGILYLYDPNGIAITGTPAIGGGIVVSNNGDLVTSYPPFLANGDLTINGDLTRGAGGAFKGKFYFMRCNLTSAQPFPSGANTEINFQPLTGNSDYGNCFDGSGGFVAPVDGIYTFTCKMNWTDSSSAHLNMVARKNGANWAIQNWPDPTSGTSGNMIPSFTLDLKVGDLMTFIVFQSSGTTWHADFLPPESCWLTVYKNP